MKFFIGPADALPIHLLQERDVSLGRVRRRAHEDASREYEKVEKREGKKNGKENDE